MEGHVALEIQDLTLAIDPMRIYSAGQRLKSNLMKNRNRIELHLQFVIRCSLKRGPRSHRQFHTLHSLLHGCAALSNSYHNVCKQGGSLNHIYGFGMTQPRRKLTTYPMTGRQANH